MDMKGEQIMQTQISPSITGEELNALSYLPDRLANEVRKTAALYGGIINEIRIRSGGVLSITVMGENIPCKTIVSEEECNEVYMKLCRNSPYSYADTIKEGFITTKEGIRAGICGRAVCNNENITAVSGVISICIRIPRRIPGAGDVVFELLREMNYEKGVIVWSIPGIGKTTVLRELAVRASVGGHPKRVAVVDTRHELGAGICCNGHLDILEGYPRSKGIEIAKRTMSPQLIICDEIANLTDADAILEAAGSGVPIVASVHAGSREDLFSLDYIKKLTGSGHIGAYVGLVSQIYGGYEYEVFRCRDNTTLKFRR